MSAYRNSLTAERLREVLAYDPETGVFTRIKQTSSNAQTGGIAGTPNGQGYLGIKVDRVRYLAHRLAFLFMLGRWPADQVDHINLIRSDNRWCNLREATQSENARNTRARHNNTSGVKGVNKYRDKWHAKISFNGRRIHLGYFDTPEEAHAVYCRAAAKYHGVYARAS